MTTDFHPGQCWISESEPELGLGKILRLNGRSVVVEFAASQTRREYARRNAPLRRVRFQPGDAIRSREGAPLDVRTVTERGALLYYGGDGRELCETDLHGAISFSKPEQRLLAGRIDHPGVFDLRFAALQHRYRQRKSPVRGFAGSRIDLIPHQLYIAAEVAARLAPRVLLADEVGLGKTIEAGLILQRLIRTGRVRRVLILVPDSLVHQWFVELLRRFNLWFNIFDEERCSAIEAANAGRNPFLDDQLILCSIRLLTAQEQRVEQVIEAGWDVLVVDEAHHLAWSPEAASPEYEIVENIARRTPGLLLLTATPEQLGMAGHFARLRLLDPQRFHDLAGFVRETERFREIALRAEATADAQALADLLDRHGTGRVLFRNTRAAISGFPARIAHLCRIEADSSRNPLLDRLAQLVRDLDPQKALIVCRTPAVVAALDKGLRQRMKNARLAVFHEGLSLVQRDRNAAWFADEHGARVLICSEIGSEGRNFQFAHHLILIDLPLDPELLEQRIGRLDRIGQTSNIHIHVPYVAGTGQEVLARWYHEGVNAFVKNLQSGMGLLERFGARVYRLAQRFDGAGLDALIEETQAHHREVAAKLQQGRDRLLELNSFRPETASRLVAEIRRHDADRSLDDFMLSVFDLYGLTVEEIAPRTWKLGSAGVLADSFPGLPAEGFSVTCDRKRALAREDLQFLTWDHPIASGALDLLLGSEKGNASFAVWPDAKAAGLYLEAVYVLECIAPAELHADRFLPPTPLRVLVNHRGADASAAEPSPMEATEEELAELLEQPELREDLLPAMLDQARDIAAGNVRAIVSQARKEAAVQLTREIERLRELQKVNPAVRSEEIDLLAAHLGALDKHLSGARLRLDAVRLIRS